MADDVTSKTRRVLDGVHHAVEALEVVGAIADKLTDSPTADELMSGVHAIAALVNGVLKGLDGALTKDEVQRVIDDFRSTIAVSDHEIAAKVDAKFPRT